MDFPMPPIMVIELDRHLCKRRGKGRPHPDAPSIAMIPARHRTPGGGTNGVLHFRSEGIDYVTSTGKGATSWRWSYIQTPAKPHTFHLPLAGPRRTLRFYC